MTLSRYRLNEWQRFRDKIAAGAPAIVDPELRARTATREVRCWEIMTNIEEHAVALVAAARTSKNIPGELRYHIDKLATATDFSSEITNRQPPQY